jgi:putative SOS response-associated peptidase YedK
VCGRYAVSARPERLADQFDVIDIFDHLPEPDYNVAPTVTVPAVLERTVRPETPEVAGGSTQAGEVRRRLAPLTWGLVPSWAKDRSIGARLINARVETVAEKPAFRKAFASRRCLLPADGFYEWYTPDGHDADSPRGKVKKQPFFLHRRDGGLLVMAGLYEIWRDPTLDRDDDAAWLRTCTVITTAATDAAGHIHDRMPMVVRPDAIDAWLDPTLTDPARVLDLLATDADELEAYAVSTEVNSVKNNGPELLLPLPETVEGPPEQAPLL